MTNPFADHQHYLPDGRSNYPGLGWGLFFRAALIRLAWFGLLAVLFMAALSPVVWAVSLFVDFIQ